MNQIRTYILSLFFVVVFIPASQAQNVGVGTSTPVEKLHVAGGLRADQLSITTSPALAPAPGTNLVVWVDANGKLYSMPAGVAGKILGIDAAGNLSWLNPGLPNTLNDGQIWIGDAANVPTPQTPSGDAIISNTGVVTIQDNAVDGTDISISGEANGSLMYFNGTDWINLGIGTLGQVLSAGAGAIPQWVDASTLYSSGNLTSPNTAITITGGTGAVLGTGATVDVAANSATSAGLVTAGSGNNSMVWGTDAAGNPGWVNANNAIVKNDVISGNAITVLNGLGQVVGGANLTISANNNALGQAGVVTGTTPANANQVWGTDAAGNPAWVNATSTINASDVTSPNPAITVSNGANQVLGAADVTIDVANNSATSAGLVAAGAGNNSMVWGTDAAGNPAWMNPNTNIVKDDVLAGAANNAVSITNGAGQVVGGTDMTVNVATNALGQAGVVTGTTPANANQVWGTDAAGNPAWVNANNALIKNDIITATTGVSITNGTGQVVGGTNVTVNVATNSNTSPGLVPTTPAGAAGQGVVWGTPTGSNVPAWIDPSSMVDVDNGLYYNAGAGKIRQGGALVENTTITEGAFNYIHNLTGIGDFDVQDNGVSAFFVGDNANVGVNTNAPSERFHIAGIANTARIEGLGTGGAHLTAAAAATDRMMYTTGTGVVKAMPNGANGSILSISNAGIPTWQNFNALVENGLHYDLAAGKIHWGGTLIENTTVTGSAFQTVFDLTGTGDFTITEASSTTPSFFVKGNDLAATDGFVGVGTNAPTNRMHINNTIAAGTTAATTSSYPFAIGFNNGLVDYTLGSNASFALEQSWNAKPLLINSQGNNVGVNLTTTPLQNVDINGRLAVRNGVIQTYGAAPTAITATSDLGLYSQFAGSWIRLVSNGAPIKFYQDQGGAGGIGTNAIVNIDNANGGGVAIGANTTGATNPTPSAKAVLDAQSTTKGQFIPRMTTAQRNAIAPGNNANEGLLIYNTDNDCVEFWDTKNTTAGINGFWNSTCKWCEDVYIYAGSSNGNNFHTQAGSPNRPKKWCVFVNAGVTLGASGTSATALTFASLPAGSTVQLFNNGTIVGGGGNGGQGGQERDAICGGDSPGGNGAGGGDAIVTSATVAVAIVNTGIIGGGGGGGGGGAGGCRSNGGGAGGGGGVAFGAGGGSNNGGQRVTGICLGGCTAAPTSQVGNPGTPTTGGLGGCSNGNSGSGCTITASNGGCGGNGGNLGVNGANGTGTTCGTLLGGAQFGIGGTAGQALRGNGSGSYLTNTGGTVFGISTP